MKISGKYIEYSSETFCIECSYDQLYDLYLALQYFMRRNDSTQDLKNRMQRWFKMLDEISTEGYEKQSFGIDYFCTSDY